MACFLVFAFEAASEATGSCPKALVAASMAKASWPTDSLASAWIVALDVLRRTLAVLQLCAFAGLQEIASRLVPLTNAVRY